MQASPFLVAARARHLGGPAARAGAMRSTRGEADRVRAFPPAVHAKGSYIYLQLWALGRAATADVLAAEGPGYDVVSASDVAFEGGAKPRPLTEEEIKRYVGHYAAAAKAFVERAGGDGVESESLSLPLASSAQTCERQADVHPLNCSPRRERVPDRPVPADQLQQAHRPLRWLG